MKSSLSDSLILLLILGSSGVADGLGSVLDVSYQHITYPLTWENAQSFCRREFTDLATFYSPSDVNAVFLKQHLSWIGLYKHTTLLFSGKWVWSDGQSYHINWQDDVENATGNCAFAAYIDKKVYVRHCGTRLFFTCRTSDKNIAFIQEAKTWPEASEYCRKYYRDLVTFSNDSFDDVFFDQDIPTWIGLHRDGASWKWSWGDIEYTNWLGELSASSDCGAISSLTKTTAPQDCGTPLPSLCIADNLVLMKEKRSWQEALERCRGLRSSSNIDLRYDLLSLQPADNRDFIKTKIMQADTEEVWTGLRFLAGDWLWVNGADMLYTDLPFCPTLGQHCGILSKSNNSSSSSSMEIRDCSEEKNFLCYSYRPVV